jgi:hypothetical protein
VLKNEVYALQGILASLANAAFAALALIYLLVALPLIWYVLQSTALA